MAAADTSAILQGVNALTQQPSPVAQYGQFANALSAGTQARQSALAFQAQQALGQAYANNRNADGTINNAGVISDLASTPAGSYALPAQVTQGQVQQANQYGLNADQLGQVQSRANAYNAALAPLLRYGNNVTRQQVFSTVAGLSAAGAPVGEFAQDAAATMPASDGQPLRDWIQNHVGRALPTGADVQMNTPSPVTQNRGGTGVVIDANPITNPGVTQGGADFKYTLSPEGQVSPVPGPLTSRGAKTVIPTATYAAQNGLGGLIPGTTGRGPAPMPAALLNGGASGGQQPQAGAGASGGSTPQAGGLDPWADSPAPPATASGGNPAAASPMPVELGPGQSAGLTTAGTASAAQWAALQSQVGGTAAGGGSAGRIYQLQKSLGLLNQLGTQGTGPSAAGTQAVVSYAQSLPVIGGLVAGVSSPADIANYDEANKYLTAYAAARAGAHGGTTDSQLATTLSSNASTHISNLAAQDVVKANLGLERMDQAQAQAFQNAKDPTTGQPLTPDQFSNFSANWNQSMDPRAFVADQLSPQQVTGLVNGMAPSDLAKFQNTYSTAIKNGWMAPPAWAQTSPSSGQTAPTGATAQPAAPPAQSSASIASPANGY